LDREGREKPLKALNLFVFSLNIALFVVQRSLPET
jgi:hypothetical protein